MITDPAGSATVLGTPCPAPASWLPDCKRAPRRVPKAAETILANSGAVIRFGGDRAIYSPMTESLRQPRRTFFHRDERLDLLNVPRRCSIAAPMTGRVCRKIVRKTNDWTYIKPCGAVVFLILTVILSHRIPNMR
jgi:hypothetical protein